MARLVGIPFAITPIDCPLLAASPRPHSLHIICKPIGGQDFRHPSRRSPCKLAAHGLVLIPVKRCHSPSRSLSCVSRSLSQEAGTCAPKRSDSIIASATPNSDQSPPSHEEDGEGAIGCCKGEGKVPPKKPSPEIEPRDVVQAQLQALCDHDFMTVFEFASPKNKEHTGPLSRFTEMIQGRAYNVMLGHKIAEVLSTLSVGPERFQQRVLITGSNGKQAIFSWSLSRQEIDPFKDCWMTDSVHRDE